MQLHELTSKNTTKAKKRVGRGGKRGTYSGHGIKGQKARAGARIRPGFAGGSTPVWKQFPKQRGATKKVEVKHSKFAVRYQKPVIVNIGAINPHFKDGDKINPKVLIKKGLAQSNKHGIKILGDGTFDKKLTFSELTFSKSALAKVEKSGSTIIIK